MAKFLVLDAKSLELKEREVNGNRVPYEALKDSVEGWIERFSFSRVLDSEGIDCWCNEEGKLIGLQEFILVVERAIAVNVFTGVTHRAVKPIEMIVGNVAFAGRTEDGDSVALTKRQLELVKKELEYIADVGVSTQNCTMCKDKQKQEMRKARLMYVN